MIKFTNVKSGQEFEAHTESQITALLGMSDLGVNARNGGQDFGWRLAPDIAAQLELYRDDPEMIDMIATKQNKDAGSITDIDILNYYSEEQRNKQVIENKQKQVNANTEALNDYKKEIEKIKNSKADKKA